MVPGWGGACAALRASSGITHCGLGSTSCASVICRAMALSLMRGAGIGSQPSASAPLRSPSPACWLAWWSTCSWPECSGEHCPENLGQLHQPSDWRC